MVGGGVLADVQLGTDLAVRQPARDQAEDLRLALGEPVGERAAAARPARRAPVTRASSAGMPTDSASDGGLGEQRAARSLGLPALDAAVRPCS